MAPDAPAPVYDTHGNQVATWSVYVTYDPGRDVVDVRWTQGEGPYHTSKNGTNSYSPVDLEDALADIQRMVRILGARRLF